jgi:hypothetical protein
MLQLDPNNPPTCGAVISKQGDQEIVCGLPATQLINMADPEDTSRIMATVLVCDEHDQALDRGETLIFVSGDGQDRIAIEYKTKEETKTDDADAE